MIRHFRIDISGLRSSYEDEGRFPSLVLSTAQHLETEPRIPKIVHKVVKMLAFPERA
jgi:hypothetical protein